MLRLSMELLLALIGLQFCCLFMSCSVAFNYGQPSETIIRDGRRIRGIRTKQDADFILGGLFAVHTDAPGGGRCGDVRLERGLERVEAMLYAIDSINNDSALLPNITLGYDIRDTCESENIGLDESIDLVISGGQFDTLLCMGETPRGNASSRVNKVGVIGASSSRVSIPVASLLRLFQVPQVSYASSSALLSNRDRYEYFYRTVPADDLQARAMIDLALHFGWTYVSTVYSNNPYGEPGIDEFRRLAAANSMCIDVDVGINDNYSQDDLKVIANRLIESTTSVVIMFISQDQADGLLGEVATILRGQNRFLWIASDSWARSITIAHKYNTTVSGLWGIAPQAKPIQGFQDYFSQLTLETNQRDPWFTEFYEAYLNCTSNSTCPDTPITDQPQYSQGTKIPLVIDAVYSIAHALNNFLTDNCDTPIKWFRSNSSCAGQKQELNGLSLLSYLRSVRFSSPTGVSVMFDSNGNAEGRYELLNYQQHTDQNGSRYYEFKSVGKWDGTREINSRLEISQTAQLQFGLSSENIVLTSRESRCQQCSPGYVRRIIESSCCGICEPCLGGSYSNNTMATECLQCPMMFWGNTPLTASNSCIPIDETFLDYSNPWAIAVVVLSAVGLLVIIFFTIVLVIHWNTPMVKSASREQIILLLVGISICFLLPFIYIARPTPILCVFQRGGGWLCFSLILGSILVKLIRLARIFLRGQGSTRPRFIAPQYQILFTSLVVLVTIVLTAMSLIVTNPKVDINQLNNSNPIDTPVILVQCSRSHPALLALLVIYHTVIIIVNNGLAIVTIRFPKNFNEAKYVSFATFALGVVWLGFLPTFVAVLNELRSAVLCLAIQMSAYSVLICLFGPKIVIILFWPKKNVKEAVQKGSEAVNRINRDSMFTQEANVIRQVVNVSPRVSQQGSHDRVCSNGTVVVTVDNEIELKRSPPPSSSPVSASPPPPPLNAPSLPANNQNGTLTLDTQH